jgi:hypothetical protein
MSLFRWVIIVLAVAPFSSCASNLEDSQSQWERGNEYFFAPLERAYLELKEEKEPEKALALLSAFQPAVYISESTPLPLDFYQDVVPRMVYRDRRTENGHWQPLTPELLEQHRDSWFIDIRYLEEPRHLSDTTVAYGRVFYDSLSLKEDEAPEDIIVLKYNFVFPYSGLPADLPGLRGLVRFMGSTEKWHWLDIHGAITIVLDSQRNPLAVNLSQHNHQRTYLVGRQVAYSPPSVSVTFSQSSHEPYPSQAEGEGRWEPAIATAESFPFLLTNRSPSWTDAYDYVPGSDEVRRLQYSVLHLPIEDPLYTAKISLGPELKLVGMIFHRSRSSPPGMNYSTRPDLLPYHRAIPFWYMNNPDPQLLTLLESSLSFGADFEDLLSFNHRRLQEDWSQLKEALTFGQ